MRREARMLVLGSRGFGSLRRRLLGSVCSALLQSVQCPIVVVREGTGLGVTGRPGRVEPSIRIG
nr:universal stress protein [Nocardia mexicana]